MASKLTGSTDQQWRKAGLAKVLVGGKSLRDFSLFHHAKAEAIHKNLAFMCAGSRASIKAKKPLVSNSTSPAINGRVNFGISQRPKRLGQLVKTKDGIIGGYFRATFKRDDPRQGFIAVGQSQRAAGFYGLKNSSELKAHLMG